MRTRSAINLNILKLIEKCTNQVAQVALAKLVPIDWLGHLHFQNLTQALIDMLKLTTLVGVFIIALEAVAHDYVKEALHFQQMLEMFRQSQRTRSTSQSEQNALFGGF